MKLSIKSKVNNIIKISKMVILILMSSFLLYPFAKPLNIINEIELISKKAPYFLNFELANPIVHEISQNVLAITGLYHSAEGKFFVNAGIIFTSRSVIFIDAGMTISSGEFLWRTAKKRMKGDEDLYLILTHRHSDHVFGMRIIKENGAKIIAHKIVSMMFKNFSGEQYKQFLVERQKWSKEKGDRIYGDVVLYEPDQIIDRDLDLNIDGDEICLLVTPGHTPDSISVYHPKSKTLFAGDCIYERSPLTTRFGGPNEWKTWISQLERLKQLDIKTIVPGHGNLCSKNEIDRNIAYLSNEIKRKK